MRLLLVILIGIAWSATNACGATLGLYSSVDCDTCGVTIAPGKTGTLYARLSDLSGLPSYVSGVTGAAFRITGLPEGWLTVTTVHPALESVIGDPFTAAGIRAFGWPPRTGTCIGFLTIEVTATSPAQDVVLRVEMNDPPDHPLSPCPIVAIDCIPGPCPFVPPLCVEGGRLRVNSSAVCSVGVAPRTWSQWKRLFAN